MYVCVCVSICTCICLCGYIACICVYKCVRASVCMYVYYSYQLNKLTVSTTTDYSLLNFYKCNTMTLYSIAVLLDSSTLQYYNALCFHYHVVPLHCHTCINSWQYSRTSIIQTPVCHYNAKGVQINEFVRISELSGKIHYLPRQ